MHKILSSLLVVGFASVAVQAAALVNPNRGVVAPAAKWNITMDPGQVSFLTEVQRAKANGILVIDRSYNLEPWMNNPVLDKAVAETVEADLKTCRDEGVRCIMGFFYSDNATDLTLLSATGVIPGKQYDAPLNIALKHWEQIGPKLAAGAPAIDQFETTFIGTWGEQAFTFNYLDADSRQKLFRAQLEALPEDLPVSYRYPRLLNDVLACGADPKFLKRSRLGMYDHCILNSAADTGTFDNIEDNVTPDNEVVGNVTKQMEGFGVATTGETCLALGMVYSAKLLQCDYSLRHMEMIHLTSLNEGFKDGPEWDAVKEWKKTGCWQKILDRLGYVPSYVKADATSVTIKNTGFASPYHPNDVYLLLVPTSQFNNAKGTITKAYRINQQIDIRTLAPGKDTTYPLTITGAGSVTLDEDYDAVMVIETGHVPDIPYRIIFTEPTQQIWKDYRANPLRDIHLTAGTVLDASAQAVPAL